MATKVVEYTEAMATADVMQDMQAELSKLAGLPPAEYAKAINAFTDGVQAKVDKRMEERVAKANAAKAERENAETTYLKTIQEALVGAWAAPELKADAGLLKLAKDGSFKRLTFYVDVNRTTEGEGDAATTKTTLAPPRTTLAAISTAKAKSGTSGSNGGGGGKKEPMSVKGPDGKTTEYESATAARNAIIPADEGKSENRGAITRKIDKLDGYEVVA